MVKVQQTFALLSIVIPLTFATALVPAPLPKKKVLVTGAAGRTGELVFSYLAQHPKFEPIGLVRTEKSAKKVIRDTKCGLEKIWVCDVTQLDPSGQNGTPKGLEDAEAMIICTSAVPKIKKSSLVKAFLKVPLNIITRKKATNFRDIQFRYKAEQYPEKVDYEGQVAQIELAKRLGISHVVLVSSMGGTNPNEFLNSIGKDKNGNGNGDILQWKRKAERYLVDSGLHYTIIHPGGLKDTPGGKHDIIFDVDDKLRDKKSTSITRSDVARLCVAALTVSNGRNTSFDCVNAETEKETSTVTAQEALSTFLEKDLVYDYSIN